MTSILYNRGTNTQAGNPVRTEFARLSAKIDAIEKKLADFLLSPAAKGAKGDRGDRGERGERGEKGEQGI